eukprot:TRINITY_DN13701_c0_g1_i1.p1 TRINITY_DN13701_c0_g1~~TRINITY_DN13701_c0_g1_i1.p1  ORF type:complete len:283 (+),score=26.23 TRINITY_DN13701_c0_g1_i1:46-849(+)
MADSVEGSNEDTIAQIMKKIVEVRTEYAKWKAIFEDEEEEVEEEDQSAGKTKLSDQEESSSESGPEPTAPIRRRTAPAKMKIEGIETLISKAISYNRNSATVEDIAEYCQKQLDKRDNENYTLESLQEHIKWTMKESTRFQRDPARSNFIILADGGDDDDPATSARNKRRGAAFAAAHARAKKSKLDKRIVAQRPKNRSGCQMCGLGFRKTNDWIMCDNCKRWFCLPCAEIDDLSLYDDNNPDHLEFVCALCAGSVSEGDDDEPFVD